MMLRKAGNLCGIAAPILWALAIVVCGRLKPGYSHWTQYISELGDRGSPTELLMRYGGFVPTGLMHIAFGGFVYRAFRGIRIAAIGASLIALNGLARIGAGMFPCEPGCAGPRVLFSQKLHSLSGAVGFFAIIIAAVLFAVYFRKSRSGDAMRRPYDLTVFSLACAVIGVVFLLLMALSGESRIATGLYERISSGALSLWLLVFAARLWRIRAFS